MLHVCEVSSINTTSLTSSATLCLQPATLYELFDVLLPLTWMQYTEQSGHTQQFRQSVQLAQHSVDERLIEL